MNPLSLKQGVDILREINIGGIQQEAEQPFTLMIVGQPELTALLAREIETVPGRGRVAQLQPPLPVGLEIQRPAVALLVSRDSVVDADLATARGQLDAAQVRHLDVVIGGAVALTADGAQAASAPQLAVSGRALLPDAPTSEDIEAQIAPALMALDPDNSAFLLPLARHFPAMRDAYIRDLIEDVSRVNAWYAFSTGIAQVVPILGLPLALADIIVLTKNQVVMAYRIALAAGKPATGRLLVGELLGVLGGGLLFRQIARELVGLAPGIGIVPKVAIAYAGTRLVGQVARVWALEDRKMDGSELTYMYREALDGGRRVAAEFQARASQIRTRGDEIPEATGGTLPAASPSPTVGDDERPAP